MSDSKLLSNEVVRPVSLPSKLTPFDRSVRDSLQTVLVLAFIVLAVSYVYSSWQWMLVIDSPIMHYVNFLMDHGFKPYADITDTNLPGSYMVEWLGMRIFGEGDLGWRIFEFTVLAISTCSMILIARPYGWAAALFASGTFIALHGAEGTQFAGEREEILTMLVLAGYAALFLSVRRQQPWLALVTGFTTAYAASIKPTFVPLAPILLLTLWIILRRRKVSAVTYLVAAIAGITVAVGLNVTFLLWHHAWHDFFSTMRLVTSYYASIKTYTIAQMLRWLFIPPTLVLLGTVGLILALSQRRWTWEQWALLLGAAVGLLSYLEQRKGFYHHRYLLINLTFLLVGIELLRALKTSGWRRNLSRVTILAVTLLYFPYSIYATARSVGKSDLLVSLESDLTNLGGAPALQGQVLCLDLVAGCLDALYHMRIVENTGFTGDMLLFAAEDGPAVRSHRVEMWKLQNANPARVVVLGNEVFGDVQSYDKVNNWPDYKNFLEKHYVLVTTRAFPLELRDTPALDARRIYGYKIYALRAGPP